MVVTAPSVVPTTPSVGTERLLVAITRQEHEVFLPGDMLEHANLPGLKIHHLPSPCSARSWEEVWHDLRPSILLSCWSTSPLPRAAVLPADSGLRYVCHLTGSVRALIPRSFLETGGLVTNWGHLASPQVAEHALLLALACLRNVANWRSYSAGKLNPGAWHSSVALRTETLFGRRVGIHGFGHVARALVRLLAPFECEVEAYSYGVPEEIMRKEGVKAAPDVRRLFANNEVIFECEALTPRTAGSVSSEVLRALPEGGIFVNVGRGAVVDEAALLHEAQSGRLRLALDVLSREPLRPDSPFWSVPGLILSPHVAGPTFDRFPDCGHRALQNIATVLRGEKPEGLLSLADYDRST